MRRFALILFTLYMVFNFAIFIASGQLEHPGTGMFVWPSSIELNSAPLVFSDTFTDSNGVALQNHVPNIGANWVKVIDKNPTHNFVIQSNWVQIDASLDGTAIGVGVIQNPPPSTADAYVTLKVTGLSTNTDSTYEIYLRYQNTNNFYRVNVYVSGSGNYSVWFDKNVAGVFTNLTNNPGTSTFPIAINDTLTFGVAGNTLYVYLNGIQKITATDSSITTAGNTGIYMGGHALWAGTDSDIAWKFDDYKVYEGSILPLPSPTPTPSPSPSPTPTPSPPPSGNMLLTFASTMYISGGGYPGDSAAQTRLATIKSYAKIMMQWWYTSPSQSWCNAALTAPTTVQYCGPYNDFGGTFTGCDVNGNNCDPNKWTPVSQWHLDNTYLLYKEHTYSEAVMDWRISAYVDYFKAILVNGWGNGLFTAKAGSGHNALFFDNGMFDGQVWWWNNTGGVARSAWKTAMLNAITTIRTYFNAQGDTMVLNAWGDMNDWDLYNADKSYYWQVANQIQYIMFEQTAFNIYNGSALSTTLVTRTINIAYDYNTNTNTLVLWSTEYGGNFWHNFVTGLFACTDTKCGFWQQPPMTQTQITKTTTMQLGIPVGAYGQSGCYYREFTNGYAVANLTGTSPASCNFTLPAGVNYTDWIAGGTVNGGTVVTLSANTSKIYIKQ